MLLPSSTRLISIGKDCTSAYLIRLLYVNDLVKEFNPDNAVNLCRQMKLGGGAYIFDWTYIDNYQKFYRALANIRYLVPFTLSSLRPFPSEAPTTVIDENLGIAWHHMFKRDHPGGIIIKDLISKDYDNCKEKANHLWTKFVKALDDFTYYIYFDSWSQDKCKALTRSLRLARSNRSFRLVYISNSHVDQVVLSQYKNLYTSSYDKLDAGCKYDLAFANEVLLVNAPSEWNIQEASQDPNNYRTQTLLNNLKTAILRDYEKHLSEHIKPVLPAFSRSKL